MRIRLWFLQFQTGTCNWRSSVYNRAYVTRKNNKNQLSEFALMLQLALSSSTFLTVLHLAFVLPIKLCSCFLSSSNANCGKLRFYFGSSKLCVRFVTYLIDDGIWIIPFSARNWNWNWKRKIYIYDRNYLFMHAWYCFSAYSMRIWKEMWVEFHKKASHWCQCILLLKIWKAARL